MSTTARTLVVKQAGYTHRVNYTKRFTGGLLVGLHADAHQHFCCAQDANKWINDYNGSHCKNPCGGSSPYTIEVNSIDKL
jgi:hypothetical protein